MAKLLCNSLFFVIVILVLSQVSFAQEDDDNDIRAPDPEMDDDMYGDEDGGGPPELKELKSVNDFEKFTNHSDPSVIAAFVADKIVDPKSKRPVDWDDEEDGEWEPPEIDNPIFTSFKSVSSTMHEYRFAYTKAPEVFEKLKTKTGGVYFYRSPRYVSKEHGDRARERFPSDTVTEAGISHWLETRAQPLVGEFNTNTMDKYKSAVLIIFMDLDFDNNAKSVNYVLKRARKVAVALKGKLTIALASRQGMRYELEDYGLTSEKNSDILMAIRGGSDDSAPKFGASREKAFSEKALSAFANAYLAGELTPHKKPENTNEGTDDELGGAKDEL